MFQTCAIIYVLDAYKVVPHLFLQVEFCRVRTLIKLAFSCNSLLKLNLMRVQNWASHQMRKCHINIMYNMYNICYILYIAINFMTVIGQCLEVCLGFVNAFTF